MQLIEKFPSTKTILGTIGFIKLKISCVIGVEETERHSEQDIYVSLEVKYDISSCVALDAFENAIDYVALADICKEIAQKGRFQLIETYANKVLDILHAQYPIHMSKIRVEKPSAISEASCSFVELDRTT